MKDVELHALALLVEAEALGRRSYDQDRLKNGSAVGYGDCISLNMERLDQELKRRAEAAIFPKVKGRGQNNETS